jgi:hypothetical protein
VFYYKNSNAAKKDGVFLVIEGLDERTGYISWRLRRSREPPRFFPPSLFMPLSFGTFLVGGRLLNVGIIVSGLSVLFSSDGDAVTFDSSDGDSVGASVGERVQWDVVGTIGSAVAFEWLDGASVGAYIGQSVG